GPARVACDPAPDGWSILAGGTALRPPRGEASLGSAGELRVAPRAEACATSTELVRLLVVGHRPVLDPASVVLFADAGRLEAHGRRLKNTVLYWRSTTA